MPSFTSPSPKRRRSYLVTLLPSSALSRPTFSPPIRMAILVPRALSQFCLSSLTRLHRLFHLLASSAFHRHLTRSHPIVLKPAFAAATANILSCHSYMSSHGLVWIGSVRSPSPYPHALSRGKEAHATPYIHLWSDCKPTPLLVLD